MAEKQILCAYGVHFDAVAGRPQVLLMLERLTSYIMSHPGVRFCTFEEMANNFANRHPRGKDSN